MADGNGDDPPIVRTIQEWLQSVLWSNASTFLEIAVASTPSAAWSSEVPPSR